MTTLYHYYRTWCWCRHWLWVVYHYGAWCYRTNLYYALYTWVNLVVMAHLYTMWHWMMMMTIWMCIYCCRTKYTDYHCEGE
jgi:hypothetical protein